MEYRLNRPYMTDILHKLLTTPSPSGFTRIIMDKIDAELKKLGYSMTYTNKGCGVVTIPCLDPSYAIGLSAHVDTLGAMVRSIKDSGKIRFTSVGGFMMGAVENEYCTVHTRDGRSYDGTILTTQPSVHVYPEARELKREESSMEVRLDEPVFTKEDVENLGIRVGDFISFDSRAQIKDNGYVKSRHLDDKASVAAIFGLLQLLRKENVTPKHTVYVFFSTYEEVGHGSSWIPGEIDELIAVDMGALGDDLSAGEQDVSICAKDSTGPYDYDMTSKLIELAQREKIRYAVDIYPHYGSDASAAQRGGQDIRAALIGPGVHASHGMERTHLDAIEGTARLLAAYIGEPAARR